VFLRKTSEKVKKNSDRGAQKALLEEMFNDTYVHRRSIYKVNFFRGIFFGAGSALGGTVVLALIVWTLSFFVQLPVIGNSIKDAQSSLQHGAQ
jgi:hypothetical protein